MCGSLSQVLHARQELISVGSVLSVAQLCEITYFLYNISHE